MVEEQRTDFRHLRSRIGVLDLPVRLAQYRLNVLRLVHKPCSVAEHDFLQNLHLCALEPILRKPDKATELMSGLPPAKVGQRLVDGLDVRIGLRVHRLQLGLFGLQLLAAGRDVLLQMGTVNLRHSLRRGTRGRLLTLLADADQGHIARGIEDGRRVFDQPADGLSETSKASARSPCDSVHHRCPSCSRFMAAPRREG